MTSLIDIVYYIDVHFLLCFNLISAFQLQIIKKKKKTDHDKPSVKIEI